MSSLLYRNSEAHSWTWTGVSHRSDEQPPVTPLAFHKTLPDYGRTPLHSLASLAKDLGIGHVLLKDESSRFGLPSFKILGASWAVYRAVAEKLGRPIEHRNPAGETSRVIPSLQSLGHDAKAAGLQLITATEGNWGRAVARMGKYLENMPVTIFVPEFMPESTRQKIRDEGAEIVVVKGNYDDAVAAARRKEKVYTEKCVLTMDFGWEGYERIPEWVVEGYSSMLDEADTEVREQTGGATATHVIVPVGVGSIAQAVTQHFKSSERAASPVTVMTVEPDTASSLKSSLEAGTMTTVPTEDTIMCGMNCGTVSTTAWPTLKAGVDAAILVTDTEAHQAVLDLGSLGIHAGPCGAATLAALRRAIEEGSEELGFNESSVVVLFCTEGARDYETPE